MRWIGDLKLKGYKPIGRYEETKILKSELAKSNLERIDPYCPRYHSQMEREHPKYTCTI
jgi:hypothetical protein